MALTKRKHQNSGQASSDRTTRSSSKGRRKLVRVPVVPKPKKKRKKTVVEEEEEWVETVPPETQEKAEKPRPKKKMKKNDKGKTNNEKKNDDDDKKKKPTKKKKGPKKKGPKKKGPKKKTNESEDQVVVETVNEEEENEEKAVGDDNNENEKDKSKKKSKKVTTTTIEDSSGDDETESEGEQEPVKKKSKKTNKKSASVPHLEADSRRQDPILMKTVCFNVEVGYGLKLAKLIEEGEAEGLVNAGAVRVEGKRFLFGTIVRRSAKKKNSAVISYDVQWETQGLREVSIDLQVLIPAIETSDRVRKLVNAKISRRNKPMYQPSHLFSPSVAHALMMIDEGEDGDPEDSDEEDKNDDEDTEDDNEDVTEVVRGLHDDIFGIIPDYREEGENGGKREEQECGDIKFRWRADANVNAPRNKSKFGKSKVKGEHAGSFASPLSSLLAFIPIKIFKAMVYFSNLYAHNEMHDKGTNKIAGAIWSTDITLSEMMVFWGILIFMCLRPTPGQTYVSCWSNYSWHPYTKYMKLRRFQQIRSVLHLNDNSKLASSNDQLYKVRLLLNSLKNTFPAYMDLGDEVALDEASVASRSKYGRNLIFYNPQKPDKYHFRFYMLCCASSFACVRLRVHTNDRSDLADGFSDDPQDEEKEDDVEDENGEDDGKKKKKKTKISSLVLDMCRPLFGSGRVVNMDNYYTSPEVAVMLARNGVYMRGTCRKNRKGFPKGVLYSKTEAAKLARGHYKMMVDPGNLLSCFGWVDGSPVQILSTADGSVSASNVRRKLGKQPTNVKAPLCVSRYNSMMQGVDRHDQMRATFSLVARHGFKKYYIKMMLGLVDMAITNAFIHFKLVNPVTCSKDTARYDFMNGLANALCTTNWNDFGQSAEGRTTDTIFQALCLSNNNDGGTVDVDIALQDEAPTEEDFRTETNHEYCVPISYKKFIDKERNKRGLFRCQVCIFEGRKTRELRNVVICSKHALRMCTIAHDHQKLYKDDDKTQEIEDYSWMAPKGLSCWQKAHDYYIPQGLFDRDPVPINADSPVTIKPKFQKSKVSSEIYTKKRIAFGFGKVRRGRKKETGEKNPLEEQESHIEEAENLRSPSSPRRSLRLTQTTHLEQVAL